MKGWKEFLAQEQLWGKLTPFLLLDSARIESLEEHLQTQDQQTVYRSLFEEEKTEHLVEVGPYLVRVDWNSVSLNWFFEELFGHSIGFMVLANTSFEELFEHLSGILRAKYQGRHFYFRYYDPRVLNSFVPVLNQQEQRDFFGPVQAFILENQEGTAINIFRAMAPNQGSIFSSPWILSSTQYESL